MTIALNTSAIPAVMVQVMRPGTAACQPTASASTSECRGENVDQGVEAI